jgi:hypothetical protein
MRRFTAFFILSLVKTFSHLFYRARFQWLGSVPPDPFFKARLFIFLNHTSLYEPLYAQALSYKFLWKLAKLANVPGADTTLNRPLVGRFWKLMLPNIASITRQKDSSWDHYLQTIDPQSIIMIAPEGRMKRPNGLDKNGRPMSVRGGVADIIESLDQGGIILCLSGGLHHVQSPGQLFPRLFKKIRMNLVYLEISDYKKSFSGTNRERKLAIIKDLQNRLEKDCPPQT